ncbi:hypothetical protein [Methanoregula sp.]|jgi:hypothetical protein|uniref:hypothetical protein n=1 Tax=Methanoregula sp. TaxID=2052170 RepID=UPI00356B235F
MKTFPPMVVLLILTAVVILCAGCTSSAPPAAVVTAEPTATAAPTAVPTMAACGIENCHGVTVMCGPNLATACSNDMDAGDRCRQYASCQVVGGSCQLVTESKFDKCVSCVKMCQSSYYNNPNMLYDCSQKC